MSSWFDRFNKIWASKGLRDDPTDAQADAGWAYIGQAPPTVEQFNAAFQWWDYKDNWLYGQISQVIIASGLVPSESDMTQLLTAIRNQQRVRLHAPLTLFVDSVNGSDTNTGASGSPFKTINRGVSFIQNDVDQGGQQVTLQLAPGTYDPVYVNSAYLGMIVIRGDPLNPRGYLIKNTNGAAVSTDSGAKLYVIGLSVEANGSETEFNTSGIGLVAVSASVIVFQDIAFGPCTGHQMWATAGAYITIADSGLSYSIYGNGYSHIMGSAGGVITIVSAHLTIQNNPTFTISFAQSSENGTIQAWNLQATGTCIGKKYYVDTCSTISVGGAGINFLPGDQAGFASTTTYGVYN